MSDTHEVKVVRVGGILPHPNADKLQLTMVGGFQIVIGKGQFKEGDLAVYIQPDSVVPQTDPFRFIWGNSTEPQSVTEPIPVPAKRRRITVKRLRKEYSEGLLMPLDSLQIPDNQLHLFTTEGTDVAALLGVTRYVPEVDVEDTNGDQSAAPKRKYPKTLKGWFFYALYRLGFKSARKSYAMEVNFPAPVYDVNALKNATRVTFRDGEMVTVTEKIHGSNARFVFILDDEKNPLGPGKFYVGSHYQWKAMGDGVFWKAADQHPEIQAWCVQNPGKILYAEVGPTQKGYNYGCGQGETFVFPFDVYDPSTSEWYWPGNVGVSDTAPVLYSGPFYPKDIVATFVDGMSVVPNATHMREGIVIHSRERRLKLKVVSNKFYEGDSK